MECPYFVKICNKCGEILIASPINFPRHKSSKYGFANECKKCIKKYKEKYRENNKEKIAQTNKLYYKNNKEKIKEKHKKYYEDNKEKINKANKRYYEENKEEMLKKMKEYKENNKEELKEKCKEYYKNNKEERLKYQKQWAKENPDKIFNNRLKYRGLKENQGSGISKNQWYEMMNFFGWCCAYSGIFIGGEENEEIRSIDHIIPISLGGLNEPWNCIPMYRYYNQSKYTNDMITWYKQQDFFDIDRLMKIYEWQEYAFEKWGNQ